MGRADWPQCGGIWRLSTSNERMKAAEVGTGEPTAHEPRRPEVTCRNGAFVFIGRVIPKVCACLDVWSRHPSAAGNA